MSAWYFVRNTYIEFGSEMSKTMEERILVGFSED